MANFSFKFISLPIGASAETPVKIDKFSFDNVYDARKTIIDQRALHKEASVWYKILDENDNVIFNSYLIHGSKSPPKQLSLEN